MSRMSCAREVVMRNVAIGILIGLIIAVPFAHTQQQPERIVVGAPLEIGMAKDKVISLVAQNGYLVVPTKGDSNQWVVSKRNEETNQYDLAGMLTFKESCLAWASRSWASSFDQSAVKVGRGFYFLMKELEERGDTKCSFETRTSDTQSFESKEVLLHCGKRNVLIDVVKINDQNPEIVIDEQAHE